MRGQPPAPAIARAPKWQRWIIVHKLKSPAFFLSFFGIVFKGLGQYTLSPNPELIHQKSFNLGLTSQDYLSSKDYEIATTTYGWNTPAWKNYTRRIVTGEFFNAILSHDHYNASAWNDLEKHPDPDRKIVAFLDVDTCNELNYPRYGPKQWWDNLDINFVAEGVFDLVYSSCEYISRAVKSPALLSNPDSRLVILDCTGNKRHHLRKTCQSALEDAPQVIIAHTSVEKSLAQKMDVGLPPPAIRPINLPEFERHKLKTCNDENRSLLFSFQGRIGQPRRLYKSRHGILQLENFTDVHVRILDQRNYVPNIPTYGDATGEDKFSYTEILQQSFFAGAPRGDNLFSYRFAEILSAGAVPVVYSDGWLPPFSTIVDWEKCAVFIPESKASETRNILLAIPDDERCQMQRCALEFWDRYASTRSGWLRGLLEVALSSSGEQHNQTELGDFARIAPSRLSMN